MPESTPRVGRWRVVGHESLSVWTCDCGYYPYMAHVVTAPCGCTRPPLPATPAPRVDGAYEAFRERVRWFYRNAPECQEARKHSFGRQADVAFTLAMNEALAALRAVPVEGDARDE